MLKLFKLGINQQKLNFILSYVKLGTLPKTDKQFAPGRRPGAKRKLI